uniref:Uncharacterized protein n=1 Tax=Leersia perrieri TaxID=77586 RepID=A0A0D9W7R4_9ORYZ
MLNQSILTSPADLFILLCCLPPSRTYTAHQQDAGKGEAQPPFWLSPDRHLLPPKSRPPTRRTELTEELAGDGGRRRTRQPAAVAGGRAGDEGHGGLRRAKP